MPLDDNRGRRGKEPLLSVRRRLRPTVGGVLPVLLPAEDGQVGNVVGEQQAVHASLRGGVGAEHLVAIAQEQAEQEAAARATVRAERRPA
jgi:hypothetical protein